MFDFLTFDTSCCKQLLKLPKKIESWYEVDTIIHCDMDWCFIDVLAYETSETTHQNNEVATSDHQRINKLGW